MTIKQNQKFSSSVALATFHVLGCHMWLVATVPAGVDGAFPSLQRAVLDSPGPENMERGRLRTEPWKARMVGRRLN